jgi:hypothetical protein
MSKAKKKRKSRRGKRKLTAAQRRARRERRENTMIVFINGKQKRVPREPTIDGLPVDEFIARNADPIWLHEMGLWELMPGDQTSDTPTADEVWSHVTASSETMPEDAEWDDGQPWPDPGEIEAGMDEDIPF